MKKETSLLYLFGTYSAIMLFMTLVCVLVIFINISRSAEKHSETVVVTDYVYVYHSDIKNSTTATETTISDTIDYIAREYEGKIGIFDKNDRLIQIIDVNVITLPEADRKLLRIGIKLSTTGELNSLIEDYTD